ncbi:FAD/NAD(P)-binding protein [Lentzea roselyniae]|uniref:FAD/NAD(P)-binding protein n=1 Tax=Lentzea roselyniae TaxID=531940 RepID=UPI0031F778C9
MPHNRSWQREIIFGRTLSCVCGECVRACRPSALSPVAKGQELFEIAIIGGGPSAACVVAAMAYRIAPEIPINVTVFEPGPNLWRGRVFQPDGDEVLANVPMEDMSAVAWDPEHGVRWFHENGLGDLAADTTVPRRHQVGRYLEDTAEQAIAAMRAAGSNVEIRTSTVTSLEMDEGKFWTHGDDWKAGSFDQVVLCLGATPSYDHYKLSSSAGYIADAYPLREALIDVPEQASVGIVGSGLTAIDVVMGLRARGHRGPITLGSRNGHLPSVRQRPARHKLQHLTVRRIEEVTAANGGLSFDDVVELAKAELVAVGTSIAKIAADFSCTTPAVTRLRNDLVRAMEDRDPGWPVLRDGMVACGQDAWYLLSDADKMRVRAWHQTLMRHCCPMPPANAALLLNMFHSGQLAITGGVRSILPRSTGGFDIDAERPAVVDVVISASTPAKHEIPPAARPLVASMESQGLVAAHPFGGVRVDRITSRLVSRRGVADSKLHALGDLTNGAYLFTFGMPVLAARADCIAMDIAATMGLFPKRS